MKKVLTLVVLLIYFTVSSGFVVSFHFCMNKLASTAIGTSDDDACGGCGMAKKANHCCWDDVKVVKLQADHFASQFKVGLLMPLLAEKPVTQFIETPFFNFLQDNSIQPDTGPPFSKQDTYLHNRVFRI